MQRQHLGVISAYGFNELVPKVLTKFDDWLEQHPGYRIGVHDDDHIPIICSIVPEDGGTEWYDIMYQKDEHGKECFVIFWVAGESSTYNDMSRTKEIKVAVPLERIPQPAAVPKASVPLPKPKAPTPQAVPKAAVPLPKRQATPPLPVPKAADPLPKRETHPPQRYTPPSPKRAARIPPAAVPKQQQPVPKPKAQPPQPQRVRRRPVIADESSEVSEADVLADIPIFTPEHPMQHPRDDRYPLPYLKQIPGRKITNQYLQAVIGVKQATVFKYIRQTGCSYAEAVRRRYAENDAYRQRKGIADEHTRRERRFARNFQNFLKKGNELLEEHRDLHPEAYEEQ